MDGLLLLCGHLIGDYIVQNDWMAKNKTNPHPGPDPAKFGSRFAKFDSWIEADDKWRLGHLACTIHCLLYTLAVWLCSFWWMPWWGLIVCFVAHWPIDRFRLARVWMMRVSGQKDFATGPLAPWSVIIVDNIAHIVTLAVIGKLATL